MAARRRHATVRIARVVQGGAGLSHPSRGPVDAKRNGDRRQGEWRRGADTRPSHAETVQGGARLGSRQKAFEVLADAATFAPRLLHRMESHAAVLGAARRRAARNGQATTSALREVLPHPALCTGGAGTVQRAFEVLADAATFAPRLLHRMESHAAILGAARRTAAGNGQATVSAPREVLPRP